MLLRLLPSFLPSFPSSQWDRGDFGSRIGRQSPDRSGRTGAERYPAEACGAGKGLVAYNGCHALRLLASNYFFSGLRSGDFFLGRSGCVHARLNRRRFSTLKLSFLNPVGGTLLHRFTEQFAK